MAVSVQITIQKHVNYSTQPRSKLVQQRIMYLYKSVPQARGIYIWSEKTIAVVQGLLWMVRTYLFIFELGTRYDVWEQFRLKETKAVRSGDVNCLLNLGAPFSKVVLRPV
jgi:hypothetical protein